MRLAASLVLGLLVAAAPHALADDGKRGHKAHQHGSGKLGIAVDGKHVTMELDAPAADILGFETVASTPEQKAAVAAAKAKLADPLSLFVLPAAAGCTLTKSEIELDQGSDDHKHDHGKGAHAVPEAGHADVEADYDFTCANPAALTTIEFAYFDAFKGAESLTVGIVTRKSQGQSVVTREKPRLDLGGLM